MFSELLQAMDQLLWRTELKTVNKIQAFLIQALRIFYGTFQDLKSGLPSLRAMSLVYTTLLSIVPLLAVSFSVLKGFGAHNQLEPALINLLEPLGEKGLADKPADYYFCRQHEGRCSGFNWPADADFYCTITG